MVTVGLFAMSGLIGMAVDFGWSFFTRRAAQAAADAAALASVNAAFDSINNGSATYLTLPAQGPADCSSGFSDTRQNACQYASQNGFSSGGDSGRQSVLVSAGTGSPFPGVSAHYWVTVQITENIPQLYSALLGNSTATIAASSTAAIVDTVVTGSVIGLDRQNDPGGPNGTVDLKLAASSIIPSAPNGIVLSSLNAGAGTCSGCTGVMNTPYTIIRSGATAGGLTITGSGTWNNSYQNQSDGQNFYDPMRNMGQPPIPLPLPSSSSTLSPVPVQNGVLTCNGTCAPGAYFATDSTNTIATGGQITISSNVTFANSANSNTWGDYVFYGGLNVTGTGVTVTFGPGSYVMAGVASASTPDLSFSSGSKVIGGSGTDAGRVFIITDPSYPGLSAIAPVPSSFGTLPPLQFGQASLSPNSIQVYGLDSTSSSLPTDTNSQGSALKDYGSLLVWQDQRFSNVVYTSSGNIATGASCGGGGTLDLPCTQTPPAPPTIVVGSGQGSQFYGRIYQPRGAYIQLLPGARLITQQLVTGAVDMQSANGTGSFLNLLPLGQPAKTRVVALIH